MNKYCRRNAVHLRSRFVQYSSTCGGLPVRAQCTVQCCEAAIDASVLLFQAANLHESVMARWQVSNEGAYRSLDDRDNAGELVDWQPGDRATLAGGLLILGYAHGVRCRLQSSNHSLLLPALLTASS